MNFNPTKLKCKKCNDVIQSEFAGHFVNCSCKGCFVDFTTSKYGRVGGEPNDYEYPYEN